MPELALAGGTVADVYTGTWIEANVEIDGRADHLRRAARRPSARGDRRQRQGRRARLHRAAHAPVVPVLAGLAARGRGARRHDDARLRQPVLLPRPRRRRAARDRRRRCAAAPAHVHWVARLAPQSAYTDEAERFATDVVAPLLSWPEVVRRGEITNWMAVARGEPRLAAGIAAAKAARRRVEGHNAGASYDRLNELSAAGISSDHEAITGEEALARLRLGHVDDAAPVLAAARTSRRCCASSPPVVDASRRLMLTTDGAVPSFYAERGVIGGALRIATEAGVDPMRALQMATIDPATFLGMDEEIGGIAPGRRATLNVLPEIGEWRPETVLVDGRVVARDGRLIRPRRSRLAGRAATRSPRPSRAEPVRAADRDRAGRALRERGDQPALGPRGRAGTPAGRARRPRRLLDHQGRGRELPRRRRRLRHHRDDLAGPARARHATRPRWPARRPRVAEMGGGFAFDGGWSAPLEIDGLIAAGGFDRCVAIERELIEADGRRRLSVPRSALQPPVRVRRLPARDPADPARGARGEVANGARARPAAALRVGTIAAPASVGGA